MKKRVNSQWPRSQEPEGQGSLEVVTSSCQSDAHNLTANGYSHLTFLNRRLIILHKIKTSPHHPCGEQTTSGVINIRMQTLTAEI